jgi:hypothetical protein
MHYISLLLIIGFPRLPGLDIPICIILLPLYYNTLIRGLGGNFIKKISIFSVITLTYGILIWLIHHDSQINDLKFLISIFIKFGLTLLMGIIVSEILINRPVLLLYWIGTQSLLIILSILDPNVFDFLVIFSGSSGYEVYSQIGGLRGIGFGVVHVYGAYTLICACFFYLMLINTKSQKFRVAMLSLSVFLSFFVARTALIVAVVSLLFGSLRKLAISIILFAITSYFFSLYGDNENILYQILEPGVNYFNTGIIYTASTNANLEMIVFPDSLTNWIIGYGKFFDEGLFFMNTDLGYSRLTLYGGLGFTLLYFLLNLYPSVKGLTLSYKIKGSMQKKYRYLFIVYGVSFVLANAKGIIDIGLFTIVTLLIIQKETTQPRIHV